MISTSNSIIMKYLVQGLWYYHTCILNWNKWEYDFIEYCHHHESLFPPHLYGMGAAALSSAFFSSWQHNRMQSPVECPVQNSPQKCPLSCPPCPRSDARYLLYWKGCVESSSIRQHHQCFLWTSHLLSKSPSLKKHAEKHVSIYLKVHILHYLAVDQSENALSIWVIHYLHFKQILLSLIFIEEQSSKIHIASTSDLLISQL